LVDTALAALILVPLFNIIAFAVYKDTPPLTKLSIIIQQSLKGAQSHTQVVQNLKQNPDYQNFLNNHGIRDAVLEQILQLLLLSGLTLAFWLKTHSTPGKMLMSMKIVDDKTMHRPSSWQLFIRMLSYPVSVLPLCLGIFYIALNKKHRAWHDLIAGTVVVYKK
jgi:uncharacterized RDD family membrane protein YckC